jgi:hypothetical protein
MHHPLICRHAERLSITPGELSAALLQYAVQQLANWTQEGDDTTIAGEKYEPGSVWHVGDPPFWLEPHMPEDWLERYHQEAF